MDINRGSFQVVASHQICDKYGAPVAYTFREDDATLYAAAPALLEALVALRDGPQIECVDDSRVQDLIRSAIAKATGADQ